MNAPVNGASNDWTTNEIQICFSKWWENEKRNSNPFFKVMRKRKTKNEIHIRFSKWCENEKRKLKLISVFLSDPKTKNEIRSSKPFFKVRRKRKTKSKIQICFSMPCENEKWIWHLNSFFPCHRKTVGTKVHALSFYFYASIIVRAAFHTLFLFYLRTPILRTYARNNYVTVDTWYIKYLQSATRLYILTTAVKEGMLIFKI